MKAIRIITCCCLLVFTQLGVMGQSKAEIKQAKHLFEGCWFNQHAKRFLSISIENNGEVLINDWTGTFKNRAHADAYKAHIKGATLQMPAVEDDHHAPDCEILLTGKRLLFQCKGLITHTADFVDKTYFIKIKPN
jgi:hypothetical protein